MARECRAPTKKHLDNNKGDQRKKHEGRLVTVGAARIMPGEAYPQRNVRAKQQGSNYKRNNKAASDLVVADLGLFMQ